MAVTWLQVDYGAVVDQDHVRYHSVHRFAKTKTSNGTEYHALVYCAAYNRRGATERYVVATVPASVMEGEDLAQRLSAIREAVTTAIRGLHCGHRFDVPPAKKLLPRAV